jgi:hypothetical protein
MQTIISDLGARQLQLHRKALATHLCYLDNLGFGGISEILFFDELAFCGIVCRTEQQIDQFVECNLPLIILEIL